jgi:hypothetical protein
MDAMLTTVILAAGLLAAAEPQAEPQKGWVVEIHGYTYHPQAKPEEWIFEVQGFIKHGAKPQPEPVEAQFDRFEFNIVDGLLVIKHEAKPQPEPVEAQFDRFEFKIVDGRLVILGPVEAQLYIEPIETQYHEDLPVFFKQLEKR